MTGHPPWMGPKPLSFSLRIKWGDCDPAGVVYTPRFADYVVEAYQDFLAHMLEGPLQEKLVEHDLGTPAKQLNIHFTRSLWPDQVIDLRVHVCDVRQRSFDIVVDALDSNGAEVFSGVLGLVCVSHDVRQARPIPPVLRERLCAYRDRFPHTAAVVRGPAEPLTLEGDIL